MSRLDKSINTLIKTSIQRSEQEQSIHTFNVVLLHTGKLILTLNWSNCHFNYINVCVLDFHRWFGSICWLPAMFYTIDLLQKRRKFGVIWYVLLIIWLASFTLESFFRKWLSKAINFGKWTAHTGKYSFESRLLKAAFKRRLWVVLEYLF